MYRYKVSYYFTMVGHEINPFDEPTIFEFDSCVELTESEALEYAIKKNFLNETPSKIVAKVEGYNAQI